MDPTAGDRLLADHKHLRSVNAHPADVCDAVRPGRQLPERDQQDGSAVASTVATLDVPHSLTSGGSYRTGRVYRRVTEKISQFGKGSAVRCRAPGALAPGPHIGNTCHVRFPWHRRATR